jgi:hypothetical protein
MGLSKSSAQVKHCAKVGYGFSLKGVVVGLAWLITHLCCEV